LQPHNHKFLKLFLALGPNAGDKTAVSNLTFTLQCLVLDKCKMIDYGLDDMSRGFLLTTALELTQPSIE
jgi:hypothetical protein